MLLLLICYQVSERVSKLFADIEVNMLDGVPQNIRSYTVRSGHDSLDEVIKQSKVNKTQV